MSSSTYWRGVFARSKPLTDEQARDMLPAAESALAAVIARGLTSSTRNILASPHWKPRDKELCVHCNHARIEHSTVETPAPCCALDDSREHACPCEAFETDENGPVHE